MHEKVSLCLKSRNVYPTKKYNKIKEVQEGIF